jgi:transposase
MNLQSAYWTKKAIAGFVEQSFGVHLPEWIVSAYLRDWGFPSQKEVRRAFEGASAPILALQAKAGRGPVAAGKLPPETTAGG